MSLVGNLPYFNFRLLLIWQDWHFLAYDRIEVRILFQYITARSVSPDVYVQDVVGNDDTIALLVFVKILG
jgi:hypothetical protein